MALQDVMPLKLNAHELLLNLIHFLNKSTKNLLKQHAVLILISGYFRNFYICKSANLNC